MKKRFFCGVIFSLILMVSFCFSVSARGVIDSGKCGEGLTWTFYDDGEMVIDGTGIMYDYTYWITDESPEGGYWHALDRPWKKYESRILKITVGSGVENIGINAFLDCKNLKTVVLHQGVKEIKESAFSNCTSLTNIVFPQDLLTIGRRAFSNCQNLAEVNIPDSVTTLGNEAFINCRSLVKIAMPDDIENMGYSIFSWCSDNGLYGKCGAYAYWNINNDVLTISGYGRIDDYHDGNFGGYHRPAPWSEWTDANGNWKKEIASRKIKKIIIEDGITYVGKSAFFELVSLVDVHIGDGVKEIHNSFSFCDNLKCVYLGRSLERIAGHFDQEYCFALGYEFGNVTFVFPDDSPVYYADENGVVFSRDGTKLLWYPPKNKATSYTIPNGVKIIYGQAFNDCDNLASIVVPHSVEIIEDAAFWLCDRLTELTLGRGIKRIDGGAITACGKLNKIYYYGTKEDWNVLGFKTHYDVAGNNKNIQSSLPKAQVIFLGRPAPEVIYSGNITTTAIWQLYDNGKLTISGTGAIPDFEVGKAPWFAYADKITAIEISDGITSIGACAFYGCKNVYGISLPGTITSIGYAAFNGCRGLSGFIVPPSVTTIGDYAFFDCKGLKYVTLYPGIIYIGSHAFDGCGGLERINLPDTITYIGDYAFSSCTSLREMVIPTGVTELRPYVFNMCTGLVKVVIHSKVEVIDYTSFCGCKCHIHGYSGSYASRYAESLGFAFVPLKFIWTDNSDWGTPELKKADEIKIFPESLKEKDLSQSITREEFAAISVKVYESLTGVKALPAVENPFNDTADVEVLKAYNLGITTGVSDNRFAPNTLLTREQAATMLTRVFKKATIPGWTVAADAEHPLTFTVPDAYWDHANISPWAVESVYFMTAHGIINGVGNNLFAPKNTTTEEEANGYANATREQALVIAVRMIENLSAKEA